MRKQTKLVAVLSAAALLALGASMTSFAAGWEKDEAGIWHYYDSNDDMVTGEWKKDGGKWFYLDDDGDMLTDSWVDDEYYVGSDGAMYVNQWYKGFGDDEDQDDPEDDGEHWYYFGSRGKKAEGKKKIGGKTYYFNTDGKMYWGWHQIDDDVYYLGGEDEGWRVENGWRWLENPAVAHDDANDEEFNYAPICNCEDEEKCDDEGWYYFQASGKMYKGSNIKKINGKKFVFNDHGQMLYEWVAGTRISVGSNAQLDGQDLATLGQKETAQEKGKASVGNMLYFLPNGTDAIDGSRAKGWYQIDGSEDVGTDEDTDWYYIKDGKAKHAEVSDFRGIKDGDDDVMVARIKVEGKWFAFNEKGQMQDGIQYIDGDIYYFDENGYQKTGKVTNVEEGNDELYTYYFSTKNAGNGKGYDDEKDGYLYWLGKRIEAQDDFALYYVRGQYYLVNSKGKLQKSVSKKYDVENPAGGTYDDLKFNISKNYVVKDITDKNGQTVSLESLAFVPHIQVKDTWLIPTTKKGEEQTLNGKQIPNVDYLSRAQWLSLVGAKEDDADDEEAAE